MIFLDRGVREGTFNSDNWAGKRTVARRKTSLNREKTECKDLELVNKEARLPTLELQSRPRNLQWIIRQSDYNWLALMTKRGGICRGNRSALIPRVFLQHLPCVRH